DYYCSSYAGSNTGLF
nr:immunoglobulin light chain junction region [Macaca mulatta]MOW06342.1 immunoglobulin light chain junction region [Macaca mulatta]MOW15732.1 immunoglobulin light chain junction region [Macaca mulatta]MOW18523.1 immunoglobulin light chain junction region [Macaca mulatta]MOW28661.1 immunoglobulin light chain junction region [Macaca mulatta]